MCTSGINFNRNSIFKSEIEDKYHDIFNPEKLIRNKLNGIYYIENIDNIKSLFRLEYDTDFPNGLSGFLEVTTFSDYASYNIETLTMNEAILNYNEHIMEKSYIELNKPILPDNRGIQDYYYKYYEDGEYSSKDLKTKITSESLEDKDKKRIIPYNNRNEKSSLLIRYCLKASNGYEYESNVVINDEDYMGENIVSFALSRVHDNYKTLKDLSLYGKYIKNAKIIPEYEDEKLSINKVRNNIRDNKSLKDLNLRFFMKLYFKTTFIPADDILSNGTESINENKKIFRFSENEYRKTRQIPNDYLLATDLYTPESYETEYNGLGNFFFNIDKDVVITRGAIKYKDEWWDPTSFESPYLSSSHREITPDLKNHVPEPNPVYIDGEKLFSYRNQFPTEGLPFDTIKDMQKNSDKYGNAHKVTFDKTENFIKEISGENVYYFATNYMDNSFNFKTKFKLEYKGVNVKSDIKKVDYSSIYGAVYDGGKNPNYITNTLNRPETSIDVNLVGDHIYKKHVDDYFNKAHDFEKHDFEKNGFYFYKHSYSDFITISYDTINPIQIERLLADGLENMMHEREKLSLNGFDVNEFVLGEKQTPGITICNNIRPVLLDKIKSDDLGKQWNIRCYKNSDFLFTPVDAGYYLFKEGRLINKESFLFETTKNPLLPIDRVVVKNIENIPNIRDTFAFQHKTTEGYNYTPIQFIKLYFDKFNKIARSMSEKYRKGVTIRREIGTEYRPPLQLSNSSSILDYISNPDGYHIIRQGSNLYKRNEREYGMYIRNYKNLNDLNSDELVADPIHIRTETNNPEYNNTFKPDRKFGDIVFSWEHYKIRSIYGRDIRQMGELSFIRPYKPKQ